MPALGVFVRLFLTSLLHSCAADAYPFVFSSILLPEKVTVQPLATGLRRMEEFACCAQGFIYPRKVVPQVIDRIRAARTRGGTLDMNLERWADGEHRARYALIPPLLQDVGSDQEKDSHEPDTWNFAFENYT